MSIANRLASALERNDERPNVELAEALVAAPDKAAITELAALLADGSKPQKHDAIKTLYEIGYRKPELIALHLDAFVALLSTRDNRMLWGALVALSTLAESHPRELAAHLDAILAAADRGSVIAKDAAMKTLSALNAVPDLNRKITPILLERLETAAVNQVPMYAELAAPSIAEKDKPAFRKIVETWHGKIPQPAKKKRLENVLRGIDV
jgi:hypothetical protein